MCNLVEQMMVDFNLDRGWREEHPSYGLNNCHQDFLCLFLIPVFLGEDFSRPKQTERLRSGRGESTWLGWIYHGIVGISGWVAAPSRARYFFGFDKGGFVFSNFFSRGDIRFFFFLFCCVYMKNEDRRVRFLGGNALITNYTSS